MRPIAIAAVLFGCAAEPSPPPEPAGPVAVGVSGAEVEALEPEPRAVEAEPVAPAPAVLSELSLTSGFIPDPALVQGVAGGPINASSWHPSCVGWVTSEPDLDLHLMSEFSLLRLLAFSEDQDLTMVIRRPDGTFLCNDDAEGRNPIIASQFHAGRHSVWIGTYEASTEAPFILGLTELSSVTATSLSPDPHRGTRLQTGFMPDPHIVRGTAGGPIDASSLGHGCVGWIGDAPDHTFVADGAFAMLRILVHAQADATLVVRLEDGTLLCADDDEGTDPIVTGAIPAGRHSIWVGSKVRGQAVVHALGFTELQSVTAATLQ